MAQDVSLPYNICVFISTLFLLEFATDKFISHAATLASVINVSELLIGLVTAGAEWEEVGSLSLRCRISPSRIRHIIEHVDKVSSPW